MAKEASQRSVKFFLQAARSSINLMDCVPGAYCFLEHPAGLGWEREYRACVSIYLAGRHID